RSGGTLWAPAACTGLALLAMSTRLLVQPMTVSLVFLGLTLFLLHYRTAEQEVAETHGPERRRQTPAVRPGRHLWALPVLFAVWANVDGWFLLGPILVFLYWLGECLERFLVVGEPELTPSDPG